MIEAGPGEPSIKDGPLSDSESQVSESEPSTTTAFIVYQQAGEEYEDGFTVAEMQQLDRQIEDDLDPDEGMFAMEVWQDMNSVARKVLRHAEQVLRSSQEETATAEQVLRSGHGAAGTVEPDLEPVNAISSAAHQMTSQPENHSPSTDQQGSSILYENSVGDKYELPYEAVREWEVNYQIPHTLCLLMR